MENTTSPAASCAQARGATPGVPPADAGQGEAGQGEGQGGDDTSEPGGHELNPEVTRLQQERATEREQWEAEREYLRGEAAAANARSTPAAAVPEPALDPESQERFNRALEQSPIVKQLRARASGAVATAVDVSLRGRDHYDAPGVRQAVLGAVSNVSDPAMIGEATEMAYEHATRSLRLDENARLKARIAELEKRNTVASGGPTGASTRAPDGAPAVAGETSAQYRARQGLPPKDSYDV